MRLMKGLEVEESKGWKRSAFHLVDIECVKRVSDRTEWEVRFLLSFRTSDISCHISTCAICCLRASSSGICFPPLIGWRKPCFEVALDEGGASSQGGNLFSIPPIQERKGGGLLSFSIPPGRETQTDSTEDDSPTGNSITYVRDLLHLSFQQIMLQQQMLMRRRGMGRKKKNT